jgi:S-adenosylmethionine synthetase
LEDRLEVVVRRREGRPPGLQPVEIVERKGLGHPDTLCDALAEQISVRLSRHYLDRFGRILHHNVDKLLLVGGRSGASFGGGGIVEPIQLYIAGRVTLEHRGVQIPADDIAIDACRDWLQSHMRGLSVDRDIQIVCRLRPGSSDLAGLFARGGPDPLANDTACGVGFSPLTDLERAVLEVERSLNGPAVKQSHPEIGEDIKVMGLRRENRIDLTIGCAFVSRFVADLDDYLRKKSAAEQLALDAARRVTACEVHAVINAADDVARGSVFLTVTGTSAESGDDGEAGRGNRVSGLITPYRPMTIEAVAGKNPATHVGKLYNLLAARISASLTTDVSKVNEAECLVLGEIGRAISDPRVVDVCVTAEGGGGAALDTYVTEVVRSELVRLSHLRDEILHEQVTVY